MTDFKPLNEVINDIVVSNSIKVEKSEFQRTKFVDSLKTERKSWIIVMNALLAYSERVQNGNLSEASFVSHGTKVIIGGKPCKIKVNGQIVAPEQLSRLIVDFSNLDQICDDIQDMINLEREGYLDDIKKTIRETKALQASMAREYKTMQSQYSHLTSTILLLIDKSSRRFRWFVDVRNYLHWSIYVSGLAVMMFMLVCTAKYLTK